MVTNNSGMRSGFLSGRFQGKIGHLFSPGGQRGPYEFAQYSLDNGAFGHDDDWNEDAWLTLLDWAKRSGQNPRWALVPDAVGNRIRTLRRWDTFSPIAKHYGWPLAFAVQDGMQPSDVPRAADVIFIGGSTEWKWRTLGIWCANFPRIHVGRVNSYHRLWDCDKAGAESVDGTGWFRGDQNQYRGLVSYLEESTTEKSLGKRATPGYDQGMANKPIASGTRKRPATTTAAHTTKPAATRTKAATAAKRPSRAGASRANATTTRTTTTSTTTGGTAGSSGGTGMGTRKR